MKSLKKAFAWGRGKPDVNEVSSQLRIISKQLERERNRLEKEERDTRARAVRARKAGQLEAYRTYAGEMVRFRRYALNVDKSRLQMLKILAHVTRAQATARASVAVEQVARILGMLGNTTDASKVVASLDEITRRLEEFEIEGGITEEAFESTSGSQVSTEDLASAMAEIDAEAGVADAGQVKKPATEAEELEEAIKSLEKELGV